MVHGQLVIDQNEFVKLDYAHLVRRVRESADRLKAETAGRRAELESLAPMVGSFCLGLAQAPHHVHRYVAPI